MYNIYYPNGICQSMDEKSRCADNIMIKRWFVALSMRKFMETREAIKRYVHTYHFERCHSAFDYKTPAECYCPAINPRFLP